MLMPGRKDGEQSPVEDNVSRAVVHGWMLGTNTTYQSFRRLAVLWGLVRAHCPLPIARPSPSVTAKILN